MDSSPAASLSFQLATRTATRPVLQRACACGGQAGVEEACEECRSAAPTLHRAAAGAGPAVAPAIVHDVLRTQGSPLDGATRQSMEQWFGHDFGDVRVHTDALAADSARAVDALAYTVGRDVVFAGQQYEPATERGRRLIAHELAHVVQQRGTRPAGPLPVEPPGSRAEREARRISSVVAGHTSGAGNRVTPTARAVARADPDVVGYTMRLGLSARTGLQFVPRNVTDTRVGPVSVQPGLLSSGASRLNVIIAENLTVRRLARQLLPLWTTATPFTPSGAAAPLPLPLITEDELARGLLAYNRYYLAVPSMTGWRAGLRFPLPVEIDEATGIATLHPLQIQRLATGFDPAWAPQLDLAAPATVAPPAATVTADVTAFLARTTTPLARGIHLGARALTNATAELPFIRETFTQLGGAAFDVALAFMDNLVNREIALLAAQRDGAAILTEIRTRLAAAPAVPTADQQASLTRATGMLTAVAGAAAQAPPGPARTRPEKTITVDTARLDGSDRTPANDVALANAILAQCNVRVLHGVNAPPVSNAQTLTWLQGDTDLRSSSSCATVTGEERALFSGADAALGLTARFRAVYVRSIGGLSASGYSCPPAHSPHPLLRGRIVIANSGDAGTLAHELGHLLINPGTPHTASGIMSARPAPPAARLPQFDDAQCVRIYNNA